MNDYERVRQILEETQAQAVQVTDQDIDRLTDGFTEQQLVWLTSLTASPENRKGVLTVLVTSLVKKIVSPGQDIRLHQENMAGGYSGRGLDFNVVTPFLKQAGYPAMRESGWLTRSLEQNRPYDENYPGKISPAVLKKAFLAILQDIQASPDMAQAYLTFTFIKLEQFRRNKQTKPVTKLPEDLANRMSVATLIQLLDKHFTTRYPVGVHGTARLPVLALYSSYQCLMNELARFKDKELLPLESHTSADTKSKRLGDIDVVQIIEKVPQPFEAVEVKSGIPISLAIVQTAYEKIKNSSVQRYYLLSTADVKINEQSAILNFIEQVKAEHGCEIIANGVLSSLRYYLRLLENVSPFLDYYAENLQKDESIKREHREKWNELLQGVMPALAESP